MPGNLQEAPETKPAYGIFKKEELDANIVSSLIGFTFVNSIRK